MLFTQNLNVIVDENFGVFANLSSRVHEVWARTIGGDLGVTFFYPLKDVFESYPFPDRHVRHQSLEGVGRAYHDHRATLMISEGEGLTKTYNRFHEVDKSSEAIRRLRDLHDEMDRAVLRAYGWDDLADELLPEFLIEETEDDHAYQGRYFWNAEGRDRVLARLLALNAERHADEMRRGVKLKGFAPSDEDDSEGEVL